MPEIERMVEQLRQLVRRRDRLFWIVALRRVVYELDGGSKPGNRGYHRDVDHLKISDWESED